MIPTTMSQQAEIVWTRPALRRGIFSYLHLYDDAPSFFQTCKKFNQDKQKLIRAHTHLVFGIKDKWRERSFDKLVREWIGFNSKVVDLKIDGRLFPFHNSFALLLNKCPLIKTLMLDLKSADLIHMKAMKLFNKLAELKHLAHLVISNMVFTTEELLELSELSLTTLRCLNCTFPADGGTALGKCKNITVLDLSKNQFEAVPISEALAPKLKKLYLQRCPRLSSFAFLKLCTNLLIIDLSFKSELGRHVKDNVLSLIGSSCPLLISLDVTGNPEITDQGLEHLAPLKELTHLSLLGCQISEKGMLALVNLKLQLLSIGMDGFKDFSFLKKMISLVKFAIAFNQYMTDEILAEFVVAHPTIKRIEIRKCKQVSQKAVNIMDIMTQRKIAFQLVT